MPGKSLPGAKAAQAVRSCKGEGRCFRGADNSVMSCGDFRAGRPAPAPCRAPASVRRQPSHFVADGALSGSGGGSCRGRSLFVERGADIAHADDAGEVVIVDHRQMADVVPLHEMTHVLERVGRTAGDQLLH
jgi:hypothetical protein